MAEERAPWVTFEQREVEDREASIKSGQYRTKDVDFILIVPHGSEGKVRIEEVYADWLAKMKRTDFGASFAPGSTRDETPVMNARFNEAWIERIEKAYDNWKRGVVMAVTGTPIQNWPAISPAQRTACIGVHLLSVEELANASDTAAEAIGMGGITLRQRARDWLKARDSEPSKLAAELEAARADASNKDVRIKSLEEQLKALGARVEALTEKA